MCLKLYTIDNSYVEFLRANKRLANVFENKADRNHFIRKYIGVVLSIEPYRYYVPLSSPKDTDYVDKEKNIIRKSIIPIIRIISQNKNGVAELKGTLKFSSMIPVPQTAITYYDIAKETDEDYKILVEKEYDFIKKNKEKILKNASVLYNQKTKELQLYPAGTKKPGYLGSVVNFKYAEHVHDDYIKIYPTASR